MVFSNTALFEEERTQVYQLFEPLVSGLLNKQISICDESFSNIFIGCRVHQRGYWNIVHLIFYVQEQGFPRHYIFSEGLNCHFLVVMLKLSNYLLILELLLIYNKNKISEKRYSHLAEV